MKTAHAAGVAVLAALFAPGVTQAAQEKEQATQLTCYQLAQDGGLTDEYMATQLCRGARSTAPAKCFLRVQDEGSLTEGQALQLCQFATPEDDPATCYLQARQKTFMDTWRGVQLCQPPVQELLRYCPVYVH